MSHQTSQYLAALNDTKLDQEVWEKAQVPQTQKADDQQVKNSAGGFSFKITPEAQLERFLILGSDKPTLYATAQVMSLQNAQNVVTMIKSGQGRKVVDMVTQISVEGRAPKNAPAVFALALVATMADADTAKLAYAALPKVCRTATDMFAFVEVLDKNGKWNNAAKRGVAEWYLGKNNDQIAYQAVKYQQRNGWSHRDVLRLAHVKPGNEQMAALFHWIVKDHERKNGIVLPDMVDTFESLQKATSAAEVVNLINTRKGVTWEMIPTSFYKDANVWEALIPTMGYTALIRKLGQLSSVGLLSSMSSSFKTVRDRLEDGAAIRKARVHPITILNAASIYKQGRGDKGSLSWNVNNQMNDVLTDAFYASFKEIEPSGQDYFIGIDCSGSMWSYKATGTNLSAATVAACMALAVAKVEKNYWIGGFSTTMGELPITPNMSLDKVEAVMNRFSWGGTDCAQPMLHAASKKIHADKFCVYTDNETWAGQVHPHVALERYREKFEPKAKLIVAGVASNNFTIANPSDSGMLDIVGFDSAAPQIISQF